MPSIKRQSKPLSVTGRVKLISDGRFPATVAMSRGLTMNMGTTAVLSTGNVDIVVISRHIEPFDPGCFTSLGIDPTRRKYLMLKSRIHYRVGFRKLARAIVECAGVGVCTSDYSELEFKKVRRPIYPLDGVNTRQGFLRISSSASRSTLPPDDDARRCAVPRRDAGASSSAASGTAPDGSTTSFIRSNISRVARDDRRFACEFDGHADGVDRMSKFT